MGLIEAPDGLHSDVPFAGFFGQGRAPPAKIRDTRIDLFPLGVGQPDGGVNVNMLPVRVHHEHIFVTRKLLGQGGAGGVHERLFVGSGFRAQDDMREIPPSLRAHPALPGFCEFQVGVKSLRLGVGGDAGSLKEEPARNLVDGESSISFGGDLSAFCQTGEFGRRPFDAMRPARLAPVCFDTQGAVDPAVKAGERFLVGVNPLQLAVVAALRAGGDHHHMNFGLLHSPREGMTLQRVAERLPNMLGSRRFRRKREGEGQHVVRRLPPVRLVAPLRREIADGLFPKDQGSVFPLQRQLALVALIIQQRAGADASRAIARQFHHGGLRPGGETRLGRAGRTQNRRAAARRRRRRTFFRTGRSRARACRRLARAATRVSWA